MSYPHTAESIHQFLIYKCIEFILENKIVYAIISNSFNIVKAIRLWNTIQQERLEKA
ncbi:1200_t:CDS:2 [Scutellospora calospora]|uniref:1200_t:CDS:1 n=1 Tax=Scutellospora calospora TaxID=85575 RepID=A0ACA9K8V0_9GLOM|nr:1200_t:CDS:2 [Scutellospora calospora]